MRKIMERFKAGAGITENDRRALADGRNYKGSELDDDYEKVSVIEQEETDWTRWVDTIFKIGEDEYWCIQWERGLTEFEPDEYLNDPYRVKKVVKTVRVETWEAMPNAN